jgi:hypothetical protein
VPFPGFLPGFVSSLGFARILLIAEASSWILRCPAQYFSIISTLVRQFLTIC